LLTLIFKISSLCVGSYFLSNHKSSPVPLFSAVLFVFIVVPLEIGGLTIGFVTLGKIENESLP
jgi:hypothetical protein